MVSPSIASATSKSSMTWRSWLRLAGIGLVLLFLIVPHLCYRAVGRPSPMVMAFLNAVGWICGLRVTTTGTRLRRDVLFVANHVSWLDILALGGAARSSFVAKSELEDVPIVGWLADQAHTVYVEREARHKAHEQVDTLRGELERGHPVTLFPEGTTWLGNEMLPFRASLFAAIIPQPERLRVQPVLLDYHGVGAEIAWIGEESGVDNFKRLTSRRGTVPLTIHYLDPLPASLGADRKAIALACREAIAQKMVEVGLSSAPVAKSL